MVWAAVRSNVVIMLFIHCLLLSPLCVGVSCWVLVFLMWFLVSVLVKQSDRAGCITLLCVMALCVLCLFLKVSWVDLQSVIVAFPADIILS